MENYKTQDLYEAAALYATGEKLIGLEKAQAVGVTRRQCYFVFLNREICQKKALEYINNELAVLAKDYGEAVKLLKSRVNTV